MMMPFLMVCLFAPSTAQPRGSDALVRDDELLECPVEVAMVVHSCYTEAAVIGSELTDDSIGGPMAALVCGLQSNNSACRPPERQEQAIHPITRPTNPNTHEGPNPSGRCGAGRAGL